jgi:chromosome segregation ATPase
VIADFLNSLEGHDGNQLLKTMHSFLSKGIIASRKGFEQITNEAKISRDEKVLEEENCKLREENERLKDHSKQLASQVQNLTEQCSNQNTAMDALKQELEKSMHCYEECRVELRDAVTQNDAHLVQIETRDALIAELKKVKGELDDTLEKSEAYCHQWGGTPGFSLSSCA